MGRGRRKGKKLTVVTSNDDTGSGGEEAIPMYKRRGRPQNSSKNEIDEDGTEKLGDDDLKLNAPSIEVKSSTLVNGKKRKRNAKEKENSDLVKAQNIGEAESKEHLTSPNGFRHNGSRRKSKPRRAAEAGVECKSKLNLSNLGNTKNLEGKQFVSMLDRVVLLRMHK